MKSFKKIWWIALVVKTVLAILIPLSNDEAYYWVWGHHLNLSYFDHPPFVGWLFALGTYFESFGNAARLPGVWLGHLTLLIWNEILKGHLDEKKKSFWLLFILFSPFFGLGSLIITPDVPLLFFWSLSLLLFIRLIETPRLSTYALFGGALGLGFCSKYTVVIFVPTALIWLIVSGKWRAVRPAFVPITIVTGLIFSAPVLIWNARHDWASFAFQLNHGLDGGGLNFRWPIDYALGQFALLFPTTIYFVLRKRSWSLLLVFGWIPIAFFLYTSFKARTEANWPMMAHPALLSLAVLNVDGNKLQLRWLKGNIVIWALAAAIVLSQVLHPWIPLPSQKLKTNEFTRFDPVSKIAPGLEAPLYLGSYQMAAAVSYTLRRQFYKLAGINRRDFYDFTPQSTPVGDRFFLCLDANDPLPDFAGKYVGKINRRLEGGFALYEVTRRAEDSLHQ